MTKRRGKSRSKIVYNRKSLILEVCSQETPPMQRARPMFADRCKVNRCPVSFVMLKAEERKVFCILPHQSIAEDFCNNGGSGDGRFRLVSTDDGLMGEGKVKTIPAVDE